MQGAWCRRSRPENPPTGGIAAMRLNEEYDTAQERGEVRRANNEKTTSRMEAVSAADIGLTHKETHDARQIRVAEQADPGIAH